MLKCKHGMPIETCSHCNGFDQKMKRVKKYRTCDLELIQLREKYERLKERYRGFNELWSEDEIQTVYKDVVLIVTPKNFKKLVFQTAIQLGRTYNAVVWCWKHLNFPKKDFHRSEIMINFMRKEKLLSD